MKEKELVLTALDIGASKVCCLISGMPEESGVLNILGYGISHHDYLKKGVVSDIKGLSEAISEAVSQAEESSKKKVQSVFFNISGTHLNAMSSRAEIVISDRDNEITRHDVERVTARAKAVNMPYERDIIYSSEQRFMVDGEEGIASPAGMFGIKLETDMFIVTAKISIIDNLKKAIKYSGLGIEDVIISPFAGLESTAAAHEKDLGVVFIDIGADITDILVSIKSKPVFLKTIPVGGDNITKKIARELSIPEPEAERLKIESLQLDDIVKDQKIHISTLSGKKAVSLKDLKKIAAEEYISIFRQVKKEIENSGYIDEVPSGAVFCGQPVIADGCIELAESVIHMPVRIGHIMGLGTTPKPLPSHLCFIAVGLLQLGIKRRMSKVSLLKLGPKNLVFALSDYIRRLYRDYF